MAETRGFPVTEFRRRTAALQERMQMADLSALMLTSPADVQYVTGFLTRFWESPARPWFIVVPAAGDPIAVIPSIGADLMATTWITDIRTWQAPDPRDDGVSLLSDTLSALVPRGARFGLPMGLETHLRMPLADFQRLIATLAPRQAIDATGIVQRVREIKSEAEIDKLRASCAVADRAFARIQDIAHRGKALDAVFRDFQIALLQEGADWVSYVAGGAGQGGYGDVISPAATRPLVRGDVLMLDTGAVRDGYFCDFDRNYAIGDAPEKSRRAYDVLFAATDRALDALTPGMLARDLHHVLETALRADGAAALSGRLGHGLGLTLTEWPSLTPLDNTELRAGMVLTIEPGVEIEPGCIMVHEENIVLRDDGAHLLSARAPAELTVLD